MKKQFSKEEARAIFERAAGRQRTANEGSGEYLTLEELEEAGRAAGLDPALIRAAVVDLSRLDRSPTFKTLLTVPTDYRQTIFIPDSTPEEIWRQVIPPAREAFGIEGWMDDRSSEYHWFDNKYGQEGARLIFEREGEGTRLTFIEGREQAVRNIFNVMGIFTVIGAILSLISALNAPAGLIVGFLFILVVYLFGWSLLYRHKKVALENINKMEELLERVDRKTL